MIPSIRVSKIAISSSSPALVTFSVISCNASLVFVSELGYSVPCCNVLNLFFLKKLSDPTVQLAVTQQGTSVEYIDNLEAQHGESRSGMWARQVRP
jgi:hypothetical protein